jgi:hypothetical protein
VRDLFCSSEHTVPWLCGVVSHGVLKHGVFYGLICSRGGKQEFMKCSLLSARSSLTKLNLHNNNMCDKREAIIRKEVEGCEGFVLEMCEIDSRRDSD